MNGADVLVERLFHHGVRTIFGMPGSHSAALYDALVRHGKIRTILIRNEQAGTFAADGYARTTGRPGVVLTTAGPGATNALTGVAEAWADSIPILLLAGQVNHDRLHEECGNYHEIELESIFAPCTNFAATVMAHDQTIGLVDRAFAAMTTGRPRPAALFLPQDLMSQDVRDVASASPTYPDLEVGSPDVELQRAAQVLLSGKRPIVIAGGGAVWANAAADVHRIAQKLDCPIVTTQNGKGIVDERDRHSLGHARSVRGRAALETADIMLAIGCRFTEVMTNFRTLRFPSRLVQIDVDQQQLGMNHPVEVGIHADARVACRILADLLPEGRTSGWGNLWDRARMASIDRPEWIIHTLRAELPENGVLFTDASEMAFRMQTDFEAYRPRTVFYPSNYIALGWGFPAAIGAAVALPDRPIVSFSGDGGFLMTAQELATAARYQLKVIAIVHNDATFGAIKNIQTNRYDGRIVDTELNNPDFVRLADAFDIPASRAPDPGTFAAALRAALARRGPTLIEVPDEWRNLRG